MNKMIVIASLITILVVGSSSVILHAGKEFRKIKYQNELTLDIPIAKINNKVIYDEVEKKEVTLYQYISDKGFPVYYSRNVHTGVCYDNQCKSLNITLYWNPTGRYLGFELPENEFLSKDDHVPFAEEEYVRLNRLLSDPNLPLGEFTYNQIAAKNKAALYNVDGVSGATSKDVLEYVIKGSAYTTYTIYELVYGNTKSEVEAWTNEVLSDEYIEDILTESPYQDKLWVVDLIDGRLAEFPLSRNVIFDLMSSTDYSLAEKCLNSLVPKDLLAKEVQYSLIEKFLTFDFGMKSWTVELLKDTPQISPEVIVKLNKELPEMEVPIISGILDIYQKKGINDSTTIATVQRIANSENKYLANKAEGYLNRVRL
ncbi:hypothetical protein [Algoriphagus resistens]|uniref:hypothetical protein n=1 Tax=Algoriphagus resistens TaxID=1750590 RepID=UPI000716974B|nr:hypothetical protein [Algoriphagus resistens]